MNMKCDENAVRESEICRGVTIKSSASIGVVMCRLLASWHGPIGSNCMSLVPCHTKMCLDTCKKMPSERWLLSSTFPAAVKRRAIICLLTESFSRDKQKLMEKVYCHFEGIYNLIYFHGNFIPTFMANNSATTSARNYAMAWLLFTSFASLNCCLSWPHAIGFSAYCLLSSFLVKTLFTVSKRDKKVKQLNQSSLLVLKTAAVVQIWTVKSVKA